MPYRIKRIYEAPASDDGLRVLVDRLWPRGLSKAKAGLDLWLKEVTPSNALRQWIHAEPEQWPLFRERYFAELSQQADAVTRLREAAAAGPVTLLTAAGNTTQNHVLVLRDFLAGS